MKPAFKDAIARYLHETIGLNVKFNECPESKTFPHILQGSYHFFEMKILGQYFLFLTPTLDVPVSPTTLAKQFTWLESETGKRAVFSAPAIDAYTRRHLIGYKIPFIIPGNQLYFPDLGIDLREYFKKQRQPDKTLTSQAQFILLAYLLKKPAIDKWTATNLATVFKTTKMTMGRAIEDLFIHELVEIVPKGRERKIQFAHTRQTLWEKALPVMSSPIYKRLYFEKFRSSEIICSGLSALAEQTMLAEPNRKVFAINHADWNRKYRNSVKASIPATDAPIEVELWRYDPIPLSINRMVDPLSLYLSLLNEQDERITQAREQLIKEFAW